MGEVTSGQSGWPVAPPKLLGAGPLQSRLQWYVPPRRMYSRRELLADRCVNFVGAALSWPSALVLMFTVRGSQMDGLKQLCFLAHGIGLVAMLNLSALYHYRSWDWK